MKRVITLASTLLALGATLLVVPSCSDSPSHLPLGPDGIANSGSASEVLPSGTAVSEQNALEQLVQATALGLQVAQARAHLRADLHASRYTAEHKLQFDDYLHGNDGDVLRTAILEKAGLGQGELDSLIARVRPLEIYMPVPGHRATWTGGGDVLVAGQLEDSDPIVATHLDGSRKAVSASSAPMTPTVSLVPVETDFSQTLDDNWQNADDDNGNAIGTYGWRHSGKIGTNLIEPCATAGCGGGGGGGTVDPPPDGLYMTYSHIDNLQEPWTKGSPEIEVHIEGPKDGDKSYGKDLACSGEHASAYRVFDQNGHDWSGNVLLFSAAELAAFNDQFTLPSENAGFNIVIWEDDDTSCVIKTDRDMYTSLGKSAASLATGVALIVTGGTSNWWKAVGSFIGAAYESAAWLKSNDDYAGVGVLMSTNGDKTVGTYRLDIEGQSNGQATLQLETN